MIKALSFIGCCFVFISCKESVKKEQLAGLLTELSSPAGDSCAEPYLTTDPNGTPLLSWIEKKNGTSTLKYSAFKNEIWSTPINISTGNNWFVNWADYPMIAAGGDGNLIAHFLEKSSSGKYAYDIKMVQSGDGGKNWSNPVLLHNDGKQAEHGFVSLVPNQDDFFVSWLDGRNSSSMEGSGHEGHHGQMTMRAAIIARNGTKKSEWELDNRVCDCCQTSAAITSKGPVVIYRDRSADEIRDISIVRFINGAWTPPRAINADNWKIDGCPVNGPRADAIGNALAVAWFTMKDKQALVNIVFSNDDGETFGQPIRIDEGKPIGRVDVVMIDKQSALISWMEGASIQAVKVSSDGTKEEKIVIASSSEARSSGFPQLTRSGSKIYVAWTDDQKKTIRVASMKL